jgi:hypothetical protein
VIRLLLLSAVVLYARAFAAGQVFVDSTLQGGLEVNNGLVKVILTPENNGYREDYAAQDSGWHLLLRSGSSLRSEPALKSNGRIAQTTYRHPRILERSGDRARVALSADAPGHALTKTILLERDKPYVQVTVEDRTTGQQELAYLLSTYSFVPDGRAYRDYAPIDFVWTPQLRPDSADVIADHTFRSPALMLQQGRRFAALIPDVEMIQPWRTVETAADVQVARAEFPMLSYGGMNWKPRSHVFYTHSDAMTSMLGDSRFSFGYFLLLNAAAEPRKGYRDAVRFHWNRWGGKNLARRDGPQAEPFAAYVRKAWHEYLPQVALDATYHGKPVTLLRQGRLAWSNNLSPSADNDCWFNVWFNALRTAYGMYLCGLTSQDVALKDRALRVLTLALEAPRRKGMAPSIFYLDSIGGHWVNDHAWGGIDGGRNFAMFHNAWTGYWLLRWADLLPDRRQEIMVQTKALADFLVAQQRPSGVIPSWYDPETLEPVETFRDENAETAGAALFLSEYSSRVKEEKYLSAAQKGMHYILSSIAPRNKWFDFETFFSCSRKPVSFFDSYTQQYPQNTLSIHQAVEACLSLYRNTLDTTYLNAGVAFLDYLCLYQQVWSPGWLSRPLFGGFGVQNTDGEWSDSRQGYFAVTLMEYAELTGSREYFERATAALRAMFSLFESPTSPRTAENYAHSAIDRPGGVTGIHWGTGSSVTSIHMIQRQFGDAHVDVRGGWGCGIDGCRIPAVRVRGEEIQVDILDNLSVSRPLRLTFGRMDRREYTVIANGRALGRFSSSDLQKGITLEL